jgi:hypothetical protein
MGSLHEDRVAGPYQIVDGLRAFGARGEPEMGPVSPGQFADPDQELRGLGREGGYLGMVTLGVGGP